MHVVCVVCVCCVYMYVLVCGVCVCAGVCVRYSAKQQEKILMHPAILFTVIVSLSSDKV